MLGQKGNRSGWWQFVAMGKSLLRSLLFGLAGATPALAQTWDPMGSFPVRATIGVVAATIAYGLLLTLNNWLRHRLVREIELLYDRAIAQRLNATNPGDVRERVITAATRVSKLIRNLLGVLLTYIYLTAIFGVLPFARNIFDTFTETSLSLLAGVWAGFVAYLPNLLILIALAIVARYIGSVLKFIFDEVGRGTISLPGFYPEWAEPTYTLLLFLLYVLVGTVAFPYLPGFDTPAFQGITLFGAILGALGARESISDVISGIVLIYTRPFLLGDRIEIIKTQGIVIEKTLFVTRIRTPKNAIVTIPNRALRDSDVINYSACLREFDVPPIVYVTVTLGYDVPWQQVYAALLEAAIKTDGIVQQPAPFVLQKSLDDYSVAYELNVHTKQPERMERIFSSLHQHIQDSCNAAGIEILSPTYAAIRDGNLTTIPEQYRDRAQRTQRFRMEMVQRRSSAGEP
ncbi:MAG: mechanosensitive ion channel domain-containing protein [Cyanobacteria bacterium J06641_5]